MKTEIENEDEKALVDLVNKKKKPETDFEKELARDIRIIKDKGGVVDIPTDI